MLVRCLRGGGGGLGTGNTMGANKAASKTDATILNLRIRALELHSGLCRLRDSAAMVRDGVGNKRNANWPDMLRQFDKLNKLTTQLTDELQRSTVEGLDHFAAIPRGVTTDGSVLPELLRTRLDADVEREFDMLRKAFEEEGGGLGGVDGKEGRIADLNAFVEEAVEGVQDFREGLVRPRGGGGGGAVAGRGGDVVLAAIANGTGLRSG